MAPLVRVVEPLELGGDVQGRARSFGGRAGSPVVPLFDVAHARDGPGRGTEAGVRIDQLDLLGLGHGVRDVAGDMEEKVGRCEWAGGLEAVQEPRCPFEQCLERRSVERQRDGRQRGPRERRLTSRLRRG